MTEQILYEIYGTKYVLIEMGAITARDTDKASKLLKKHDGIWQGIKEINRGGLFSSSVVIVKVLIPERNIIAFNEENSF